MEERRLKRKKGFRIYMQQLSSKKGLYVISPERKNQVSGSSICCMLTSSPKFFLICKNKVCFSLTFFLSLSLFNKRVLMPRYQHRWKSRPTKRWKCFLGLGESSTRTRFLVDSYQSLVSVWISSLKPFDNRLRHISGVPSLWDQKDPRRNFLMHSLPKY